MPRPWRIEYEGACYHVLNRGNYRRNLFAEGGAGQAFERTLGEAAEQYGWRVHAYVIMRNHFHLAVELTEPNLSEGMKWLQGTWIRRYNGKRRLVGRPFQGRYKALVVEPGHAWGQVCHYIHLNPARAGVVAADHLAQYALSSLPKFVVRKQRARWLQPSTVLAEAGMLADTPSGWRRYVDYLAFLATDELAQKELVARRLSRGWCLGSHGFKREHQKEAAQRGADLERGRFAGLEPTEAQQERRARWEERLAAYARAAGCDLTKLGRKKSDPGKVLLAAAMKRSTSVSNRWLAERLAMGAPASVSQFVLRSRRNEAQQQAIKQLLSIVET